MPVVRINYKTSPTVKRKWLACDICDAIVPPEVTLRLFMVVWLRIWMWWRFPGLTRRFPCRAGGGHC